MWHRMPTEYSKCQLLQQTLPVWNLMKNFHNRRRSETVVDDIGQLFNRGCFAELQSVAANIKNDKMSANYFYITHRYRPYNHQIITRCQQWFMKAIDWALMGQGEKLIAAVHQLKYASHSKYTAGIFSPLINYTSPDTASGQHHRGYAPPCLKWNRNDITVLQKEHWNTRRQRLLPRVNWYIQSSLKHITE